MSTSRHRKITVDSLAEEFLARQRMGESPSIEEYALQYPDLADEIRDVLPAMQFIEEFKRPGRDAKSRESLRTTEEVEQPTDFADYEILRVIGRGGMGVVYEATQKSLNRQVALKVLPADFAMSRNAVARFQQEARAAATLHHTNIVPVYEVGFENGHHFYSMQFIDGQGLDALINQIAHSRREKSKHASAERFDVHRRANLHQTSADLRMSSDGRSGDNNDQLKFQETAILNDDTDRGSIEDHEFEVRTQFDPRPLIQRLEAEGDQFKVIARIGMQAASALAHANDHGIVHRDVKPANMLMDQKCNVWLADFGLAKFDEENLTRTGDIVGTLRYMAPERFEGKCDARSDIYSLGMSLYELIALRPAFDANNRLSLLEQIRIQVPQRLKAIDHRAPRDLVTIINKATDKEPNRRYQSAVEFAKDLSRFIGNRPIHARRIGWGERLIRWSKKNPALSMALLTIVLLMMTGIVSLSIGMEYFRQQESQQRILAETNRQHLYDAEMKLAFDELESKSGVKHVREILERWIPHEGEEDLRGWEWYFLDNACKQESFVLETQARMIRSSQSPSGRYLATLSGVLDVIDLESLSLIHTFLGNRPAIYTDLNWRSETELWVMREGNQIFRFDVKRRSELAPISLESRAHRFVLHPHRDLMVLLDSEKRHILCDSKSGKTIHVLKANSMGALKQAGMAFDSSGKWFASANEDHTISIYDVDSWEHVYCITTEHDNMIEHIRWAPNQQKLATTDWTGRVSVIEFDGSLSKSRLVQNHDAPMLVACWNQQGSKLAYAGNDQLVRIWDENEQEIVREFYGHYKKITGLHFNKSRNSFLSVSEDTTVRNWELNSRDAFVMRRFASRNNHNHQVNWLDNGLLDTRGYLEAHNELAHQLWTAAGKRTGQPIPDWLVFWSSTARHVFCVRQGMLGWYQVNASNSPDDWTLVDSAPMSHAGYEGVAFNQYSNTVLANRYDPANKQFALWKYELKPKLIATKLFKTEYLLAIEIDQHGKTFVLSDEGSPAVFDMSNGEKLHRFDHLFGLTAATWSQDNRYLALSGNEGNIEIYETKNWSLVGQLKGHGRQVRAMKYHPNQERLATVGDDGFLRIWNTRTFRLVVAIEHESDVVDLDWCDDGKSLATATLHGYFRIWHAK